MTKLLLNNGADITLAIDRDSFSFDRIERFELIDSINPIIEMLYFVFEAAKKKILNKDVMSSCFVHLINKLAPLVNALTSLTELERILKAYSLFKDFDNIWMRSQRFLAILIEKITLLKLKKENCLLKENNEVLTKKCLDLETRLQNIESMLNIANTKKRKSCEKSSEESNLQNEQMDSQDQSSDLFEEEQDNSEEHKKKKFKKKLSSSQTATTKSSSESSSSSSDSQSGTSQLSDEVVSIIIDGTKNLPNMDSKTSLDLKILSGSIEDGRVIEARESSKKRHARDEGYNYNDKERNNLLNRFREDYLNCETVHAKDLLGFRENLGLSH